MLIAVGRTMTQMLLTSPRSLVTRYDGMTPPLNSMVNRISSRKKFRPMSVLRESAYAPVTDRSMLSAVPMNVTNSVTPRER